MQVSQISFHMDVQDDQDLDLFAYSEYWAQSSEQGICSANVNLLKIFCDWLTWSR